MPVSKQEVQRDWFFPRLVDLLWLYRWNVNIMLRFCTNILCSIRWWNWIKCRSCSVICLVLCLTSANWSLFPQKVVHWIVKSGSHLSQRMKSPCWGLEHFLWKLAEWSSSHSCALSCPNCCPGPGRWKSRRSKCASRGGAAVEAFKLADHQASYLWMLHPWIFSSWSHLLGPDVTAKTGNGKWGTGNEKGGTRNVDWGTGTRKWGKGNGSRERGKGKEEQGTVDAKMGACMEVLN